MRGGFPVARALVRLSNFRICADKVVWRYRCGREARARVRGEILFVFTPRTYPQDVLVCCSSREDATDAARNDQNARELRLRRIVRYRRAIRRVILHRGD